MDEDNTLQDVKEEFLHSELVDLAMSSADKMNIDSAHEHDLDMFDMSDWSASELLSANRPVQQQPFFHDSKDEMNDGDTVSTGAFNKKNNAPTIATIYEPKFYEIYQAYFQYILHNEADLVLQSLHQQHLMTMCLHYLISFCNWSRDCVNGNWIRATLFENSDMRPEVRNGLAMILVYVFSAAKAAECRQIIPGVGMNDMFAVLMKADTGLGIVNKTSLKIYSDPFGYFNFLKVCSTSLYALLFLALIVSLSR